MTKKTNDDLDGLAKEITAMDPNTEQLSDAEQKALDSASASLDALDDLVEGDQEEVVQSDAIDDLDIEEIVEPEVLKADEALGDDDLQDLELQIDKEESYNAQESAKVETVDGTGSVTKKATGAKRGPAKPRQPRDLNAVEPKHFVLTGDPTALTADALEQNKKDVIAATPTQVKVAEKFENVIQSIAVGKKPSKYVMTVFDLLEANKKVSTADIVAALKTSGVGDGTARSQSGQMMVLLPALGVATKNGKDLELSADSNVAAFLRTVV